MSYKQVLEITIANSKLVISFFVLVYIDDYTYNYIITDFI